eukprot:312025-Rhodomonas_salina.1
MFPAPEFEDLETSMQRLEADGCIHVVRCSDSMLTVASMVSVAQTQFNMLLGNLPPKYDEDPL